ncbi:MAG: sugar MFS transporter [Bacteroidota bacterium]
METVETKKSYLPALIALTSLFFMWGFITCMNDILVPYLKKLFELSYFEAMLVQFSFFTAYFIGSLLYFIVSVSTGDPIMRIGYKNGIIIGLLLSAIGCGLFYPAAASKSYGFFLTALFVLALGFTILQIAANPYVAALGKPEGASSRLNLSQAFNSFGTTIAPIFGGFMVFKFFALMGEPLTNSLGQPIELSPGHYISANGVQLPYLIFAGIFLLLAVFFVFMKLPKFSAEGAIEKGAGALKHRPLVLGIVAIFMYVGAEVAIGSLLINYMKEMFSYPEVEAKSFLAFYWGGAMIGRFLGAISLGGMKNKIKKALLMLVVSIATFMVIFFAVNYEGGISFLRIAPFLIFLALNFVGFMLGRSLPHRTLMIFSLIVIILLITAISSTGMTALWTIIGIGLFNSIMWSNLFTLAINGLGKHTSQGSSLLVMAILGGAIIPLIQGAVADAIGIHYSYFVPILSYVYLAYYGWKGYKAVNS